MPLIRGALNLESAMYPLVTLGHSQSPTLAPPNQPQSVRPTHPPLTQLLTKENKFGQLIDASIRPFCNVRRTDQQTYLPIEMQFYISLMFLSLPDKIQEVKPSISEFEKNALLTDRWADHLTDQPTDQPTDGQTLL